MVLQARHEAICSGTEEERESGRDQELSREILKADQQWRVLLVEKGAKVLETAIRFGALALVAYWVTRSIDHLAGQRTIANIGVRFLTNVRISEAVAWIFGASGVGYELSQRKLRHLETRKMGDRLRRYEEHLDPRRSSSHLESQGDYRED